MSAEIIKICLIPTRNNEGHIERCLKAASLWADKIVVCDQMSTDETRAICAKFSKVILIDNNTIEYNESHRQKLLINEARKIEGQRLLISLDADEMFTPNVLKSNEWERMLKVKPGTIIKFQWANFRSDFKTMWLGYHFPWGYMDDGYEHNENKSIHSGRIPLPEGHDIITMNDVKVIHFQFTDWKKMQSKHRYYQCYELINSPDKNAVDIFRQYHHMLAVPQENIIPIPHEWINEYKKYFIDITINYPESNNWFEEQVVNFLDKYGTDTFKKLNIWDVDWVKIALNRGKYFPEKFKDPRSFKDKFIQMWLIKTQNKLDKRFFRRVDRVLKKIY